MGSRGGGSCPIFLGYRNHFLPIPQVCLVLTITLQWHSVFLILPQDQGSGDLLSQKVHLGVIARESASLAFLSLEDEIEKWLCRDTGPLRRSVVPLPPEASRTTYFFFQCVCVGDLSACMSLHHTHAWYLGRPERGWNWKVQIVVSYPVGAEN